MDSSFRYLPPTIPGRQELEDMLVWYASMEIRHELLDWESDLMAELVERVIEMVATWQPTTALHEEYVRKGRVLDWMVWSTVSSASESLTAIFTDPEDCLEPWGIAIDSLPRYNYGPNWVAKKPQPADPDAWMYRA